MTKIVFQGKEYDSLADMPAKTRHNYFKVKAGYVIPETESKDNSGMMLGSMENLPDDVRDIYERVRSEFDVKPIGTKGSQIDKLPKTEDLFRRSAPENLRNTFSNESIYKTPPPPVIESDYTLRRLLVWLALILFLAGVIFMLYMGS